MAIYDNDLLDILKIPYSVDRNLIYGAFEVMHRNSEGTNMQEWPIKNWAPFCTKESVGECRFLESSLKGICE